MGAMRKIANEKEGRSPSLLFSLIHAAPQPNKCLEGTIFIYTTNLLDQSVKLLFIFFSFLHEDLALQCIWDVRQSIRS